jgi:hypothetical protein
MDRLWFRAGQDFLKARIVSKRMPFPTHSQIRKSDAVVNVIPLRGLLERHVAIVVAMDQSFYCRKICMFVKSKVTA